MPSLSKPRLLLGLSLLMIAGVAVWLTLRSGKTPAPATTLAPRSPVVTDQPPSGLAPATATAPLASQTTAAVSSPASAASAPSSKTPDAQLASATQPAPAVPPVAPASAPASASSAQPAEVRSTRAMYMAHASLRAPEVANPDSEANRQILQTMVEKALANRQETAR